MQQRALIEPRVPILYVLYIQFLLPVAHTRDHRPRKRKHKVKEVEKFAWKHFERE